MAKQPLFGADAKAWFATGLEELRSALYPAFSSQVQSPLMPGTLGIPTTGEATAARMGAVRELEQLRGTFEVPTQQPTSQPVARPDVQAHVPKPEIQPEMER